MPEPARTTRREPAHWLTRHEPNRHPATLLLAREKPGQSTVASADRRRLLRSTGSQHACTRPAQS
eukprot:14624345-Alexandrium_andersonii.AAC.1